MSDIEEDGTMHQVDLSVAKDQLSDLLALALKGEEVIFTRDNQPVLKIVQIGSSQKPTKPSRRKAGSARGLISMSPDFDEPLEDFEEYTR
jgi:antitoxin (DNA-binding transcriptional repressor) of toxin-antitoxin stability system